MNGYIQVQDVAAQWGITVRQVQLLCKSGRVEGAIKFGNTWAIPLTSKKPNHLNKEVKDK